MAEPQRFTLLTQFLESITSASILWNFMQMGSIFEQLKAEGA